MFRFAANSPCNSATARRLRSALASALVLGVASFMPVAAHAGPFGDLLKRKALSAAEQAIDETLKKRPRSTSSGPQAGATQPSGAAAVPKRAAAPAPLAQTKGWQMIRPDQARLVNDLGESFTITRVANGYTFELVIPSAKPEELNLWNPNFDVEGIPNSYIEFDHAIPLDYLARVCRTRDMPNPDACANSRHRKSDDNTIFLWAPTLREAPKLKTVFDTLAAGKVIRVEYLFPSERKNARFSTAGGADVRQLLKD